MNGWLSPQGKFHSCGIREHRQKAKELFLDSKNPEKLVEDLHWVKITPNYILGPSENAFATFLTQSQIDWLQDLIDGPDNQGDYEYMFKRILEEMES